MTPTTITTGRELEERLQRELAEPFDPADVRWKPQAVSGERCMAICYIDARHVMTRLDRVMGIANWKDEYQTLADGAVLCRLSLKLGGEWIAKEDVGGQSEQPDGGDRQKAAVSDALKRAAVKFGVGRYLYDLPRQWVAYDPQKKRITGTPTLPDWAVPKKSNLPANGTELKRRLAVKDALLAEAKAIDPGELVKHVMETATKGGMGADATKWNAEQIRVLAHAGASWVKSLQGEEAAA